MLLILPDDLLLGVFKFLKDEEIVSKCTIVSRRFNLISNNRNVWLMRNTVDRYQFKRILYIQQKSDGIQQKSDGIQQKSDGIQQKSDGIQQNSDGIQQNSLRVHAVIHRPSDMKMFITIQPKYFISCESIDRLYLNKCMIVVSQHEIICIGRNINKQKEEKKTLNIVDIDYFTRIVKYSLHDSTLKLDVQVRIYMYMIDYMNECFTIEEKEEDDKSTNEVKQNIIIHVNCMIWCIFIILKTIPFNALEGLLQYMATLFPVDKLKDKHWKSINYILTHPLKVDGIDNDIVAVDSVIN